MPETPGTIAARAGRGLRDLTDTLGVEIAPGQDDIILLACTVCLDQMAHD
jgi:hypothetical protein